MVDVGGKPETAREAVACGRVRVAAETLRLIEAQSRGETGAGLSKGDVLAVAQIAGIGAAKRTSDLIPLCHPLPLNAVDVSLRADPESSSVEITATVRAVARTGVEMEALTAVVGAALAVYDMCKAVDKNMLIEGVRLLKKTGGAGGDFFAPE